jgi:hypothetical protein
VGENGPPRQNKRTVLGVEMFHCCRRDRTNPSRLSGGTAIRHGETLEAAVDFYALSGGVPASSLEPFRPPTRVAFDLLGREDISAGPYG